MLALVLPAGSALKSLREECMAKQVPNDHISTNCGDN